MGEGSDIRCRHTEKCDRTKRIGFDLGPFFVCVSLFFLSLHKNAIRREEMVYSADRCRGRDSSCTPEKKLSCQSLWPMHCPLAEEMLLESKLII